MTKATDKYPIVSIVDDDKSVLVAVHSLVSSYGFEAFMFLSAEEFLQSPRLNDTSCLISDVQMPSMSGIDLQQVLLAQGHKIPTIFMTAFSSDRIKARALANGAMFFLIKPLETNTLMECIKAAINRNDQEGEGSRKC